jgi:hypothetical protein
MLISPGFIGERGCPFDLPQSSSGGRVAYRQVYIGKLTKFPKGGKEEEKKWHR